MLYHLHVKGRHFVRCKACFQGTNTEIPDVKKTPRHCSGKYGISRRGCEQPFSYHKEAMRAYKISKLPPIQRVQSGPIPKSITVLNNEYANKIGQLMIHAYCDAKKLTPTGYNFPARVVTSQLSAKFDYSDPSTSCRRPESFELQHVSPMGHHELLEAIVMSDRERIYEKLCNDTLAISIRCDGSVDKTQIDKIFTICKIISRSGEEEDIFLGAKEPTSRGAVGVFEAMQTGIQNTVGFDAANYVLKNSSSIATDGTSLNSGDRNGLWQLFERCDIRSESEVPLLKIWCAVHRSNLA